MAFQAVAAPMVLSWQHDAEGRYVSACSTQNVLHITLLKIAYAVEHVKRLVQLTLGHCALTEVAHFHSGSYAIALVSSEFFLKWSELGKMKDSVIASALERCGDSNIIVYLNALECQISRYSMSIVPNIQAGKWALALPRPKPLTSS